MNKIKRLVYLFLVLLCFCSYTQSFTIVYADTKADTKTDGAETKVTDKALNDAVSKAKKYTDGGKAGLIKSKKDGILKVWAYGKSKGWSDSAISGLIANGIVESGLNAGASGSYLGVFQVNGNRANSLKSRKCNHKKNSSGVCSKWWCQAMWAIDISKGQFDGAKANCKALIKNWDKQREKLINAGAKYSSGGITIKGKDLKTAKEMGFKDFKGYETYKSIENPYLAGAYFATSWEVCQGMLYMMGNKSYSEPTGNTGSYACKEAGTRTAISEVLCEAYTGVEVEDLKDVKDEEGKSSAEEVAKTAVTTGGMSESEFVQWKNQTEITITFEDAKSLSAEDLYNLKAWQEDIEKDSSDNILITGGRYIVLIFGILFEVWMLFIYLAYWFDRINNFVDIDLLKIVTFGRLVISPTEEECTFSMRDLAKGDTRTINHRHIIMVCIIGLAFGTLIVSGKLFTIVNNIVTGVLDYIG